ncbi:hypothetical protein PENSPDRAFT_692796 [Peniophora sp. CONT]|nr:hypothetical protein PENSPDRAFT_692796 [Peniophora sp. CONT]
MRDGLLRAAGFARLLQLNPNSDPSLPHRQMATLPVGPLPPGTPLYDIHNTFGAILIGCLISIGILGMTMVQAWFYYDHFPKDPLWLKLVVTAICVVEIVRSTFNCHMVYYYLVQNWGNVLGLNTIVWSLRTINLTTSITKLLGHLFFSWRIYTLSPRGKFRYIATAVAVVPTLLDLSTAMVAFSYIVRAPNFDQYNQGKQEIISPLAFAVSMTADATVSICLIFVLSRTKTGFSSTNRILNSLIFYAVEVGLVSVLLGAASVALNHYVNSASIRFDYIGVYAVTGNLYANALLATLNARLKLRNDFAVHTTSNLLQVSNEGHEQSPTTFFKRRNASLAQARDAHAHRAVHLQTFVTTTVEVGQDKKSANEGVLSISPGINPEP